MDSMRLVKSREVVVKKMVQDVFDVPMLDLEKHVKLEVDQLNNRVFLNGMLIRVASVLNYSHRHMYTGILTISVEIGLARGRLHLDVDELVFLDGHVPSGAKLVETIDPDAGSKP